MRTKKTPFQAVVAVLLCLLAGSLQAQQHPSYGPSITADQAKPLAAKALAEAKRNGWNVAIAVVDTYGVLVYYEKMEDTQTASPAIAIEKARTAAMFRRPTRVLQDGINKGGSPSLLGLAGAMPVAGGLPIYMGGKVIGAIGVSGVTADQDEQVAKAGLEGVK